MTLPDDEVDVVFDQEGESFTIRVGAIPLEIGRKIDECLMKSAYVFKAGITEDISEEDLLKVNQQSAIASELLCKYGIRSHGGLFDSNGDEILCIIETEPETGYKILGKETLNLYLSNTQFLKPVADKLTELRGNGALAKYKVERTEEKGKEGKKEEVPFTKELET